MTSAPAAFRLFPATRPAQPVSARLVKICGWCPTPRKRAREAAAHALDCAVSHGICPVCRDRMLGELAAKRRAS